jgi:hypothetical protein
MSLPLGAAIAAGQWSRIALTLDGSRLIYSMVDPKGRTLWCATASSSTAGSFQGHLARFRHSSLPTETASGSFART